MSVIDEAFDWLNGQLKQHESRQVTYWALGDSVTITQATLGQTRTELDNGDGAIVEGRVCDWLIDAADIVIGGRAILPEPGHAIIDASGDKTIEYLVTDMGNEPCYRFMDRRQKKLRIHSIIKRIT